MANVLSKEKREQVLALGRLGWTLRRIEDATGVWRETASGYLKDAGIASRVPVGEGARQIRPWRPPMGVESQNRPTRFPQTPRRPRTEREIPAESIRFCVIGLRRNR